ncbi:MAG TPA: YceI family protein [Gammaproteobacteria bacterium]|jgi:polyisoprenoid-binding protein YceI|nr:YceI family protein [Gammaproteobacteria bacterium]
MTSTKLVSALFGIACSALAGAALAAPATYNIDPAHTYPTFEADHMGISFWRGKINSSSGKVTLDKAAGTGTVDVTMDMKSIDFGHQGLNDHAQTPDLFDTAKFPTATFTGKLVKFRDGAPTAVEGTLTLHGVTKPVTLTIDKFVCKEHPMMKREVCGADATAQINREDFGISFGKQMGFNMGVTLRISVEALAAG